MADFPAERSEGGDLRLTHDPESGCERCPLDGVVWSTALLRKRRPDAPVVDTRCGANWRGPTHNAFHPAPTWCPLRSGTVTVSPPDGGER